MDVMVVDVNPGRATKRMRVARPMRGGDRICHGGYVLMLANINITVDPR